MKLENYVCGKWIEGEGEGVPLVDPVTGEEVARASSEGLDLAAALGYARDTGGAALRAMTYGERGEMLKKAAEVLGGQRDAYRDIARRNVGDTRRDARVDVDGGIGTLKYIGALGSKLGAARHLVEPARDRLGRDERFQAGHLWCAIPGAAVHINAFNFPAWGLWEKAAVALLSGVPVVVKPATPTAWLARRMVKDVIDAGVLPAGALSIVCGGARDLVDHTQGGDAIAFTGSAQTAHALRTHPKVVGSGVRLNVEADSLNACLLGPDARAGSPEFDLFVAEIVREMTVKAGQKCTAIRRVLVPAELLDAVSEALQARLAEVVTGDPADETVTMGPLVNKAQQAAAWEGIAQLESEAQVVHGGEREFEPVGADPARGCFVPPTLLRCERPAQGRLVHEVEVFGPVSTLMPYASPEEAFAFAARGGGSLVASVFTGDDDFAREAAVRLGPTHGRVLVMDASVAEANTGHGIVMPQCVHGGPGRAGGGEELGGLRGLRLYHQRTAVQASTARLDALGADAAELTL